MRLEQYLRAAAGRLMGSDTPHLDVRLLTGHALGLSAAEIILCTDRMLSAEEAARLDALVERRRLGESVAHILGRKEFYGLDFELQPGILSPRPDTETLIEAAARRRDRAAPLRILDLGVGSGAVLAALLTHFPNATGVGVDVNESAARLAAWNAERLGLRARSAFLCADWARALDARFDLVVSNPPYIPETERSALPPEVRDFEDPRALFGGADGLGAYRAIFAEAPRLLAPDGLISLEFGKDQAAALEALAQNAFPQAHISLDADLAARPRVLSVELRRQKNI